MKKIVSANKRVTSDVDSRFYLESVLQHNYGMIFPDLALLGISIFALANPNAWTTMTGSLRTKLHRTSAACEI